MSRPTLIVSASTTPLSLSPLPELPSPVFVPSIRWCRHSAYLRALDHHLVSSSSFSILLALLHLTSHYHPILLPVSPHFSYLLAITTYLSLLYTFALGVRRITWDPSPITGEDRMSTCKSWAVQGLTLVVAMTLSNFPAFVLREEEAFVRLSAWGVTSLIGAAIVFHAVKVAEQGDVQVSNAYNSLLAGAGGRESDMEEWERVCLKEEMGTELLV